jgi:hypothetical protein
VDKDYPCTGCEHLDSEHYDPFNKYGKIPRWCEKCFYVHRNDMRWQHVFKADNLKYLENKLNEIPK